MWERSPGGCVIAAAVLLPCCCIGKHIISTTLYRISEVISNLGMSGRRASGVD
jgi:hypothetical protein